MAKGRLFVRQCASSVSSAWNTPDSRSETQNRHAASTRRGNEERSQEAPLLGITSYSPINTGPRHSIGSRSESFKRLTSHILTCSLPSPFSARQEHERKCNSNYITEADCRQIAVTLAVYLHSSTLVRPRGVHAGVQDYRFEIARPLLLLLLFLLLDWRRGRGGFLPHAA